MKSLSLLLALLKLNLGPLKFISQLLLRRLILLKGFILHFDINYEILYLFDIHPTFFFEDCELISYVFEFLLFLRQHLL